MTRAPINPQLPATRITPEQHAKLKALAEKHFRTLADQARYCLELGIAVEEANGMRSYIKQVVKDAIKEDLPGILSTKPEKEERGERERERERERESKDSAAGSRAK